MSALGEKPNIKESKKITGNIMALGGSEILSRIVAFIGTAYIARTLGPEGFGIVGFATALCGYIAIAVNAGFNDVGAREVARNPSDAPKVALGVTLVRLLIALLASIAILILAWLIDKPYTVKLVIALTGLSFFTMALDTSWVCKGLEKNRLVGLALLLGRSLYVATVLVVVSSPDDVTLVPIAQFFGDLSSALFLAVSVFHLKGLKPELHYGLSILKQSGFLIVTKIMRALIVSLDVVMLGIMIGEREVGLYSAPYRICFLFYALVNVITIAYLPSMTRAVPDSNISVSGIFHRSLDFSSVIFIPIVVGGVILSGPLLTMLFGPKYIDGINAFRILLLCVGCAYIYGSVHNIFLVYEKLKIETMIIGTAAGVNAVLNFILIPRFGLTGAALATLVAEGLIMIGGLIGINFIGIKFNILPLLKPLLAAGIMGGCLIYIAPGFPLFVSIFFGVVIYSTTLVVIQGVPIELKPYMKSITSLLSKST